MFKGIATVIFTPAMRIPAPLYATLQIVAAAASALAYEETCRQAENATSLLQAVVLVLMWINYCILANRFHDANVSGLWLLPLFLLGTTIYLVELDPVLLGRDWATHDLWSQRLEFGRRVFALMACMTAGLGVVAPSSEGRNRFGMPFGEQDWTRAEHLTAGGTVHHFKSHRPRVAAEPEIDTATQIRGVRNALRTGRSAR